MFAIFSFTFPAKVKLVHGFLKKVWSSAVFSYSIWQGFKQQYFFFVIIPPQKKKKKKKTFSLHIANIVQEGIYYMVPFPFDFSTSCANYLPFLSSLGGVGGICVN